MYSQSCLFITLLHNVPVRVYVRYPPPVPAVLYDVYTYTYISGLLDKVRSITAYTLVTVLAVKTGSRASPYRFETEEEFTVVSWIQLVRLVFRAVCMVSSSFKPFILTNYHISRFF
jgi:hypothetical protein